MIELLVMIDNSVYGSPGSLNWGENHTRGNLARLSDEMISTRTLGMSFKAPHSQTSRYAGGVGRTVGMCPAICKKGFEGLLLVLASRPADARLLHASNDRNFHTRKWKISFVISSRTKDNWCTEAHTYQ